jgi:hypothetical protein
METRTKLRWISVLLLLFAPLLVPADFVHNAARSVRPFGSSTLLASTRFDSSQSAGLFVGVRRFSRDASLTEVRYAADDAVDLAYAFAMDAKEALVRPSRVVIALSGQPYKKASKERLKALTAAGARVVTSVNQDDLLELLHQQAALAGRDGMLIVSFATHGFATDGVQYLLGASSILPIVSTTLSAPEIADIVAGSNARRSLILLDACRERVDAHSRSTVRDPRSAAPLIEKMVYVEGQVIFHAAAHGGYAYDDATRGNGVFTAAVIDALECEPGQRSTVITVEQLAERVEKQVLADLQKRDPAARKATQISTEGFTKFMPLAQCRTTSVGSPATVGKVSAYGSMLQAVDAGGRSLWERQLGGTIRQTFVEQLFREDTRHVIVLSDDPHGTSSVVSIYDNAGNLFAAYEHDGLLRRLEIARPTWRHNPRIVAVGVGREAAAKLDIRGTVPAVLLLEPKNSGGAKEKWYGAILDTREAITQLRIEGDHRERSIVLSTSAGSTIRLDFDGSVIDIQRGRHAATQFSLIAAP